MSARSLLAAFGLAAGFLVGTLAEPADAQPTTSTWRAPGTPWGDPDLQGTWTNVAATPLERPRDLAGKPVLTEEERAERFRQFTLETTTDTAPPAGSAGSHNEYWRERGVLLQRTSLLVDPPDGRLPPLTREAQQARSRLAAARRTSPADGPESRDLFERCVTRGLPGTMMGNFYNHNYEILQTPDHVVILAEMIHDARIIPLDGRPHVDRWIGQWLGDSRGRWEGDTLVVETTNLRAVDQTTISRGLGVITLGTSAAARVVERFTRRGPEAIDYQVTVDDPAVLYRTVDGGGPDDDPGGSSLRIRLPRGQLRHGGYPGRLSRRGARRRGGQSAVTSSSGRPSPPTTSSRTNCAR